jgi:superfamily I DNA and/or RNA helicase
LTFSGIIVGTLGSIGNNMLKGLEFQWVIVDEAGQATEPATLGALRHRCPSSESADGYPRLVFVGDHKQLPPVVAEETIAITPAIPSSLKQTGLQVTDSLKTSLFERLFRLWKDGTENVVILSQQYRMNKAISKIIQRAFYPQVNYVPANKQIGQHTLAEYLEAFTIPKTREGQRLERTEKIFTPEIPVVFINTTGDKAAFEGIENTALQTETCFNIREAKIIANLIADFLQPFYKKDQIIIAGQLGVISPYRHQNNLIYSELRELGIPEEVIESIRVDTVDRFQGDEREIIILSLTNSNKENSIGQLHREWRRMNVSISRAKAKLVIVGNKETFVGESEDEKEVEAKALFRIVFQTIEELKKEKQALELASKKDFIDIDN